MKTPLKLILILIVGTIFYSSTTLYKKTPHTPTLNTELRKEIVNIIPRVVTSKVELKPIKGYNQFLNAVGFRESSNNYKAINQFGYLGRYQFGRTTLNNLGYKKVSNKEFLSSPQLQDKAMNTLLKHNKKILRRQIKKYNNKLVNGVLITESGILAAAHLAGPSNVKKWFRKGLEFQDGNGTKMTSYLKQFANYKLYL